MQKIKKNMIIQIENGEDAVYSYNGKAGLQVGFLDRLILGMKKEILNLAFSGEM